jgi:hypothetical protein
MWWLGPCARRRRDSVQNCSRNRLGLRDLVQNSGPCARQMRWTELALISTTFAIAKVQWVAPAVAPNIEFARI